MATQWKINTANTVTIDLRPYDIYAATSFQLYYKLKGALNTTDSGAVWAEVTHNIAVPVTFNTVGITATGSATLTVDVATGIVAGQVFQAGSVYIYVSSIVGTTITLRRLTSGTIAAATAFSQVGNTGIYETDLTLTSLGQYILLISNPSVGLLNEATKVEVVANTIDDLNNTVTSSSTGINTKLDDIQTSLGIVDVSITGKLII
jgi:hypothetical protein